MGKHTPGPWMAHFKEAYFVTGPDLGRVAMMMNLKGALGLGGRRSGDESAANCRLIAAAPELLEALEVICEALEDDDSVSALQIARNFGRSTIAKATGKQP